MTDSQSRYIPALTMKDLEVFQDGKLRSGLSAGSNAQTAAALWVVSGISGQVKSPPALHSFPASMAPVFFGPLNDCSRAAAAGLEV